MSIENQTETKADDLSHLNGEVSMNESESEICDGLDHIPLKERLRLILLSSNPEHERETKRLKRSPAPVDSAIKTEEAQCGSETFLGQSAVSLAGGLKDGRSSQEQICAFADRAPTTNVTAVTKEIVLALPAACLAGEMKTARIRKRNADVVPKVATKVGSVTVMQCLENARTYQDEDLPQTCDIGETKENNTAFSIIRAEDEEDTLRMENLDANLHSQPEHPTLSIPTIKVKLEHSDNDLMTPTCHGAVVEPIKVKTEVLDEFVTDELDHIPLKERQRMLLVRQSMETVSQLNSPGSLEGAYLESSASHGDDIYQLNAGKVKEESHPIEEHPLARNESLSILETNASNLFKTSTFDSPNSIAVPSCTIPESSIKASNFEDILSSESSISCGIQENEQLHSSHITSSELKSPAKQEVLPTIPQIMVGSALPAFLVKVKVEAMENGLEGSCRNEPSISFNDNRLAVKSEIGVSTEYFDDELDHMPLRERIKLLNSRKISNLDCSTSLNCLWEAVPPPLKCKPAVPENAKPAVSENSKPTVINRQRKRKKTATDSAETALEEDAPGLLQVLIDKGILVDEIKLYGGMEGEEALDSSFDEESFEDLEAVISKLFAQRASLFRFAPLRCGKASKASNYCLACLVSLVEQSRYLQFRKWPVEWGWCRDLQSFIFVFQRHNRIVLERPEYGYATYFFELVDSLPIDWQIKRLVTAMKLTSCSRTTIIENRSLLVGEDLTEGEARVLEEYGWIPNSGLGSMLNYCDRVLHDRKNEKDGSEWRSKIGNLLVTGLNGGTLVLNNLPKKVMGYKGTSSSQIKLEL